MREQPSQRAKEALVEELREAVGDEEVARADLDVDRAILGQRGRAPGEAKRSRLLFAVAAGAGVAVAAAIGLALQSWWLLVPLLALHAVVTAIVVRTVFTASTEVEKPAPTIQAMLEDEGVPDPEGALNDLVAQVSGDDDGSRAERTLRGRDPRPRDAGGCANDAARQQESWTPDSPARGGRSV
jgi:hypothetical protein